MKAEELSVLIIEDDLAVLKLRQNQLDILGISDYSAAASEKEAGAYFRERDYDLVISDTRGVKEDEKTSTLMGPNAIKAARQLGRTPLVIALSGDDKAKELWTGESRADYFFIKPAPTLRVLEGILAERFQIEFS